MTDKTRSLQKLVGAERDFRRQVFTERAHTRTTHYSHAKRVSFWNPGGGGDYRQSSLLLSFLSCHISFSFTFSYSVFPLSPSINILSMTDSLWSTSKRLIMLHHISLPVWNFLISSRWILGMLPCDCCDLHIYWDFFFSASPMCSTLLPDFLNVYSSYESAVRDPHSHIQYSSNIRSQAESTDDSSL